ncbi:MAG: toll/interleukin-1 receptor domain-containing protein [Oscillospiraceae bacterium]
MESITRGNSSPRGKARVYITGHSKDISKYITVISEMILERCNCAVYYDKEPESFSEEELMSMNLAVVAVTRSILDFDDPVFTEILSLFQKANIPVLPILTEKLSGNEMLRINSKLGEIQCLDPNSDDNTEIEFNEKLDKYLNSVLIKDDYISRIKEAFDAYVFISYRKKDRAYANQLIDIIHRNPFMRDIAVWYDEFLVPGEKFDDSIKKVLEKSSLFVMNITPNLIEDNYIQNIEYPIAKKIGKSILPVEMVKTDISELNRRYEALPECIPFNETAINERIYQQLSSIARTPDDDDPEHNFFIGLAYLYGIDTRKDNELAVKLITESAKQGVPEAMKQLANMYLTGNCVEKKLDLAAFWQERYAKSLYEKYLHEKNVANAESFLNEYSSLSDIYYEKHQAENLLELGKLLCEAVVNITEHDTEVPRAYRIERFSLIGTIISIDGFIMQEDYKSALERGLFIYDWISRNVDHVHSEVGRAMAEIDYKMVALKVSSIYRNIYDYENQKKYVELSKRYSEDPKFVYSYNKAETILKEANAYRDSGNIDMAEKAYNNAIASLETIYAEEKDNGSLFQLCLARAERIRMLFITKEFAKAEPLACDNLNDLYRLCENDCYENRRLLMMGLEQYSVSLIKIGKLIKAFMLNQVEYQKAAKENYELFPDDWEVKKDLARYYIHNAELFYITAIRLSEGSDIGNLLIACGAISEPISINTAMNTAVRLQRTAREIYYDHYSASSGSDLRYAYFALDLAEASKTLGEYYVAASKIVDEPDELLISMRKQAVLCFEECYTVLFDKLISTYFKDLTFEACIYAGMLSRNRSDDDAAIRHFLFAANTFMSAYISGGDINDLVKAIGSMTDLANVYDHSGRIEQAFDIYKQIIAHSVNKLNYLMILHYSAFAEMKLSLYVDPEAAAEYKKSAAEKIRILIKNNPENENYPNWLKICLE